MYAVIITPTTEVSVVGFPQASDSKRQYEEMSQAVGGYIEHVRVICHGIGLDMWVNEEGLLQRLPYNPLATFLYESTYDTQGLIVGTAIITSGTRGGDTLPLTQAQVDAVLHEVSVYAEHNGVEIDVA